MPTWQAAVVAYAIFEISEPTGWVRRMKPDGTNEYPQKGTPDA